MTRSATRPVPTTIITDMEVPDTIIRLIRTGIMLMGLELAEGPGGRASTITKAQVKIWLH